VGGLAGIFSGTTATLVIVDGWTVTCACVGDSRCVLDAQGTVTALTIDHRFDTNDEECVVPPLSVPIFSIARN
jgi:hypothetical protein